MEIVRYPHPALRWKSKPITRIDAHLQATVREMFELMHESHGIGLAANQVALPYRLFILNLTGEPENSDEEIVFVNPEIIRRKGTEEGEEGCLSFPELFLPVRRAAEIVVNAFDLKGHEFELALDELPGRAVQHEYDHLDGVVFTDRVSEATKREIAPQLRDFEAHFRRQQADGSFPSNADIERKLQELEQRLCA